MLSLIPDGTFSTLLSNLRGVDNPNQKRLVELAQKSDWAGIVAFSQENLARDPTNADWWIISGYAYGQLNQFARANQSFAEAVRLSPDDIDAWNLLGQSYRALGQPERAIRTLDNALLVSQQSPMTYFLLGESFRDLKRPERAVPYYESAVQRQPHFASAWYSLGLSYWELGKRDNYAHAVTALRSLNPQAAEKLAALDSGARSK